MATEQGPFDQLLNQPEAPEPPERDNAARYVGGTIIGLAILLLVLILPPISILSRGDGGSNELGAGPGVADTYTAEPRSGVPKLPPGLVASSPLYDMSAPEDQQGASRITVSLNEQETDARGLSLYTYDGDQWQRLSEVTLVAGGMGARGNVGALPGNVIILRRSDTTLQVAASLAAGAELDAEAAAAITTLHPIVFIPAADGGLAGTPPAVPLAAYKVVPGVVALDPEVVNDLLRSSDLRTRHAEAIAEAVKQGNFAGIDVDYHSVNPSLREEYSDFIEQLAAALEADGRTLTLTLPLPVAVEGSVDAGAYDWERLGQLADSIELVGEVDQELYFQRTEAALDYIVERVDRDKLLLTIVSLSVERGSDGLRVLPLVEALTIAGQVATQSDSEITPSSQATLLAPNLATSEGSTGLAWDDAARAVTFRYPGRGGQRTVWIANRFSVSYRLELAQRYELAGIAMSDASTATTGSTVWQAVRELTDSGELTLLKPNGEMLVPQWSTPDGVINPATGDTVTWTAPADAGSYGVTLTVSDGASRVATRAALEVVPPPDVPDGE